MRFIQPINISSPIEILSQKHIWNIWNFIQFNFLRQFSHAELFEKIVCIFIFDEFFELFSSTFLFRAW